MLENLENDRVLIELDEETNNMLLELVANDETNPLNLSPQEYFDRLVMDWISIDDD